MSYVGDRLPATERDALRRRFGLPPWRTTREALPEPAPSPPVTIEALRRQRAELTWSAYDHLMREPARDRLGSAV